MNRGGGRGFGGRGGGGGRGGFGRGGRGGGGGDFNGDARGAKRRYPGNDGGGYDKKARFQQDLNPSEVISVGKISHVSEDKLVCKISLEEQVPMFNAPVFLENKTHIGRSDEIFGQLNNVLMSVTLNDTIKPDSLDKKQEVFMDPQKILPKSRFLPKDPPDPLAPKVKRPKGASNGFSGGRGGRGGFRGRGGGFGGGGGGFGGGRGGGFGGRGGGGGGGGFGGGRGGGGGFGGRGGGGGFGGGRGGGGGGRGFGGRGGGGGGRGRY